MAVAETARLIASLELKDNFTSTLKKVDAGLGNVEKSLGRIGRSRAIAVGIGVGLERLAEKGIGLAVDAVQGGVESLTQLESAATAVGAAISQMGLASEVTAGQVATWSNEIEDSVGAAFDDKAILAASTTLIRFGKITADNLRPALVVMTDLATKTGSVESASTLLARALADPDKAAGKLARSGVILTKVQQDQIKAMTKAGDVAGAQAYLLDQLTTATKGAAFASQGPAQRAMSLLADAVEDAQRALAEGLLPVIVEVRDQMTTLLKDPRTLGSIREFGKSLAGVFRGGIEFARKIPWGTIGDAMRIAGEGAKAVLSFFTSLPPWVQTAVITGWGFNKISGGVLTSALSGLSKGIGEWVIDKFKGVLGITAGVVNVTGPVAGVPGAAAGGAAAAGGGVKGFLTTALKLALPVVAFEAVKLVKEQLDQGLNAQSSGIVANTKAMIENGAKTEALESALAATKDGIKQFNAGPLTDLLYGQQISDLETAAKMLEAAIVSAPRRESGGAREYFHGQGQTDIANAVAKGTEAGLVHSGLFKEAQGIRETAGATRSGDLLRDFIRAGKFGADTQTLAQAVALGLSNNVLLVENPKKDAADLESARKNLDSIRTLQARLIANGDKNGAASLQPSIDSLEAAVNRTTEAVKLQKQKDIFTNIIRIAISGTKVTWTAATRTGEDRGTVIPPTALGGIFTKPQVRLIGEDGPEAVVPLKGNPFERLASMLKVPRMAEGGVVGRTVQFEPYAPRLAPQTLNLNVSTSISARQNDHGTRVQRRWGPTPTTANVR